MINSVLLLLAVTASQAHTPSATVVGDIVTIDADIAYISDPSAGVEPETLQGVPLVRTTVTASHDGASPVRWRLPPGDYEITAYGFPDDRANPVRNVAILTVTIQAPDRSDAIATPAAFNLMDYAEPTAFVAVLGLFIWGITKAIPLLLDKREKQLAKALVREDKIREAHMAADKESREAFPAELRYHHEEFTKNVGDARRMFAEELQAHRAQSKTLANEGHKAVEKLASSFDDLEHTFREMMDKVADRSTA